MDAVIPYSFYGANADALYSREPEMVLSGPADTGKTLALLVKCHLMALKYNGASIVILRRKAADLYGSALVTFKEKVLQASGTDGIVLPYGGVNKPQWYDYPNGSRIWLTGLYGSRSTAQISSKVLSAEHDIIYAVQAEELSLAEWESLLSRATGRAGHVPYAQLIGDCNPAHRMHWIKQRAKQGLLTLYASRHQDNPSLYDPVTGELTEGGADRIARLQRMTGARLLRLYHGLWVAPELAIYDIFDEDKHIIKSFTPPTSWPRVVGVDPVGAFTAAVWLAWDPRAQVLHLYREYYEPFGRTTPGHAAELLRLSRSEPIFAWCGGSLSENQARVDFQGAGVPLVEPPHGDVWAGIDRVYQLLKECSIVVHDNCQNIISEIGSYERKKDREGDATDKIEGKEKYHLLDALRYAVVWLTAAPETRVIYDPVRIGEWR